MCAIYTAHAIGNPYLIRTLKINKERSIGENSEQYEFYFQMHGERPIP